MKRKIITLLFALSIATISIIACGNKTDNNTEINTEIVEPLPWLALGSLESHPDLRTKFDAHFNITGETGNKVGSIYYNTDTEKADQNVTLYMVLKNTSTRNAFINAASMEALGNIALENYVDIDESDVSAPYAAVNAYFDLLPDEDEGQFDGASTISRAQAMTLLMRATTVVNEAGAPETNKDFTSAVGESQFTDFAAPMNEFAYINTSNGLNQGSFITAMTKGEYICMVTNLIKADYLAEIEAQGYEDIYANAEVTLSTIKDAGDITLKEAMNDPSQGIPTDMYNTFKTAVQHGLLPESVLEDWDTSITKAEAIELFVGMAANYSSNIGNVLYTGSDTAVDSETVGSNEEAELADFADTLPGEGTNDEKLLAWVKSQGGDYMFGWTVIFEHGRGAGSEPTYGLYLKPGSDRYGERFVVGDYLPCGTQLTGTWEEYQEWMGQDFINQAEENGDEVIYEDDKVIIVID